MVVGCAWFLHANYHITHRLAAQFHWWYAYLSINHRIQESTDQWQSQSNNEIVLGENGTHILSGHLLDPKGWIPTTCQSWIIRSNGTQSMELDPMIRAWKHDTSTDHVIAMKINLSYTLSSWGGNEKLFL